MSAEALKPLVFAALLTLFFAMAWWGTYLLRSRPRRHGIVMLATGVFFLLVYAWSARAYYISYEFDLEFAEGRHGRRSGEASVERARQEYDLSGRLERYQDEKGEWRSFSPSREDRIRRERRVARIERLRRGMTLSELALYAALAALPLAVLGGLLWPRRPLSLPPTPVQPAPGPRRWRMPVTLLEIAIALATLGVLAVVFKPVEDRNLVAVSTVRHAAVRLEVLKPRIEEYRRSRNAWPEKNTDIGLPEAGYAVVEMQYSFQLQGDGGVLLKTRWGEVSFRPAVGLKGELAWLCAGEPVPEGFRVIGENRTTVARSGLPGECLR